MNIRLLDDIYPIGADYYEVVNAGEISMSGRSYIGVVTNLNQGDVVNMRDFDSAVEKEVYYNKLLNYHGDGSRVFVLDSENLELCRIILSADGTVEQPDIDDVELSEAECQMIKNDWLPVLGKYITAEHKLIVTIAKQQTGLAVSNISREDWAC